MPSCTSTPAWDAQASRRHWLDQVTAERAVALVEVAEAAEGRRARLRSTSSVRKCPCREGRSTHFESLEVSRPEAALRTVEVHHKAFNAAGLEAALTRSIGLVVQPGVEFASTEVIPYKPEKARRLAGALADLPGFVFEAHSTDYQPAACLAALVTDGFAILKVGPWLTFAMREALYGLDCIARVLAPSPTDDSLPAAMEALMLREPGNWRKYYEGSPDELRLQRHFSFSDRIRYYWPHPEAQAAVDRLFAKLGDRQFPSLSSASIWAVFTPKWSTVRSQRGPET